MEKLTHKELQITTKEIKEKFDKAAINKIDLIGTNILDYPELIKFLGDEPYEKMVEKGLVSLKPGIYKLIEPPFYKTSLTYPTFAAKVLYFADTEDRCIEYIANIGPLVNSTAIYQDLGGDGTQNKLFFKFREDRQSDTPSDFYLSSKTIFFNGIYENEKFFWVRSSEFSKDYPNSKQVMWTFFN